LVVLLISFFPLFETTAAPPDPPGLPEFAELANTKATLVSESGDISFELIPALVDAKQVDENSYLLVFEVGISSDLLQEKEGNLLGRPNPIDLLDMFPGVALADSESVNTCDSTVSVCAQLFLYYTQIGNHGWYNYTTVKWTRVDPAVSWSNARLLAGCAAEWYPGPGSCISEVSNYIGSPGSGSTYSLTPWFSGSSNQVKMNEVDGIRGSQEIRLTRGGTSWWFTFCLAHGGEITQPGCY
jgi:hypothetical protein